MYYAWSRRLNTPQNTSELARSYDEAIRHLCVCGPWNRVITNALCEAIAVNHHWVIVHMNTVIVT